MSGSSADLRQVVAAEADGPLAPALANLVDAARDRFEPAVLGILFYGSCRRDQTLSGVVDLYVLLDSYQHLPWLERWLGRLLPPSVYYLEAGPENARLRCKCTVIGAEQFHRGTRRWFLPYLWGRFAQPTRIAYAADEAERERVLDSLCAAAHRFMSASLSFQEDQTTARSLWTSGLRASFNTELRAESEERPRQVFEADQGYYELLTASRLQAADDGMFVNPLTIAERRRGRFLWRLRAAAGKFVSIGRVLKNVVTFTDGLDYVVWKLERHSGRDIEVPDRVRRRPLIYLWPFLWQLYRQDYFR